MEKVIVNKKIKKELDEAYFWLGEINVKRKLTNAYYNNVCNFKNFDCPELLKLDEDIFYSILANGYRLDETEEEKLLRYYNSAKELNEDYDKGFMDGVNKVLELYEIKVEGIN